MRDQRVDGRSPGMAASVFRTPAGQPQQGASGPAAEGPRAPKRVRATYGSGRCGVAKNKLPLRHLRASQPSSQTVPSRGSLRRLARRAGVKRISGRMYPAIRKCLVSYLKNVLPDAIALAEHCRRMTVTVNDILLALKRRGQTLYGFGSGHFLVTPAVRRIRRAPCPEAIQAAARRAAEASVRRSTGAAASSSYRSSAVFSAGGNEDASAESPSVDLPVVAIPAASSPAGDEFVDLTPERRQEIQDALGWYVGESGVAPVQLAVLRSRLAADMASGEAPSRPCSLGELETALRAMEVDGEDAPVMLVPSPDGVTVHFTF